jgi:hypothetical protein
LKERSRNSCVAETVLHVACQQRQSKCENKK